MSNFLIRNIQLHVNNFMYLIFLIFKIHFLEVFNLILNILLKFSSIMLQAFNIYPSEFILDKY